MNRPIIRVYVARPAAVRAPRLLHLEVGGVRRRRARGQDREPPPADRGAADPARHDHDRRRRADRRVQARGRRRTTRSTCAATRRARCSATRSATTSSTSGDSGIERSENDLLTGEQNEFASIIDQLRNDPPEGADITLTLDAGAQQLATDQLQSAIASTPGSSGAGGSVVAIEPVDGRGEGDGLGSRLRPERRRGPGRRSSSCNRTSRRAAGQPADPEHLPAGLDDEGGDRRRGARLGRVHARHACSAADSPQEIGGVPLENAGGEQLRRHRHDYALTHSVNTYFAQVGEQLGTETMFEYMERFGFYADPELDYPDDADGARAASTTRAATWSSPTSTSAAIDIGRAAIGRARLLATPLQMAEVAATVANDGDADEADLPAAGEGPRRADDRGARPATSSPSVISPGDGRRADRDDDQRHRGGNGGRADRRRRSSFAGKTGTAEIDVEAGHQPALVHRLRAGRRPADRGRGDARALHRAASAARSPGRSRPR